MKNIIIIFLLLLITATGYTQKKTGTAKKQISKNISGKSKAVNKQAAVADKPIISKNADGTITISGTVCDTIGPIPAVHISPRFTRTYTQTDLDGNFTINVQPNEIIEISYINYKTQFLTTNNSENTIIMLEPAPLQPNNYVKIDRYGDSTEKPFICGGTIINVSEIQDMEKNPVPNTSARQLKSIKYDTLRSGWVVASNVPNIFLAPWSYKEHTIIKKQGRKKSTIAYRLAYGYTNGKPLYIIDDIPTDEDGFRLLDQNKIKTFETLKDKASTSESGNRGAGAIIRITTNMLRKEKKKFRKVLEQNEIKNTNDSNDAILKSLQGNLISIDASTGSAIANNTNRPEYLPFTTVNEITLTDSITKTPEQQFMADFNNKNLRLYVLGGIATVIKVTEHEFAKQSGFSYHDFGCLAPPDISYYDKYNQLVLNHLKLNLKQGWQKQIAPNTIGLQNWKGKQ